MRNRHRKGSKRSQKGYLQALRNRIALLESRLANQGYCAHDESSSEQGASTSTALSPAPAQNDYSQNIMSQYACNMFASNSMPPLDLGIYYADDAQANMSRTITQSLFRASSPESIIHDPVVIISSGEINVSPSQHIEFDQLYFDRIQPSTPMLHQRRYLSWSRQDDKSTSRRALQYSMWMLASLVSLQRDNSHEKLYDAAKVEVELSSKQRDASALPVQDPELIQAIILISTYESMTGFHDLAWMSAGRAFRMVQLMRLHEVDGPVQNPFIDQHDIVEKEELRRAFWMAYLLDSLFAVRGNWPVGLTENTIQTRLPMPESDFQNEQPIHTDFLLDAIVEPIPQPRSPFSESIIFATICSRNHVPSRANNLSVIIEDTSSSWESSQSPLTEESPPRMHFIWHYDPPSASTPDPMLILANMLAQLSVVLFHRQLCQANVDSLAICMDHLADSQSRALVAAERIVDVTGELTNLHYSRIHPLLPIMLRLTADFLYANNNLPQARQSLAKFVHMLNRLRVFSDENTNYAEFLGVAGFVDRPILGTMEM